PTTQRGDRIDRNGFGAGPAFLYETTERLYLVGSAHLRLDTGGSTSVIPNKPKSKFGWEAELGFMHLFRGEKVTLEPRLRVLSEQTSWKSVLGPEGKFTPLIVIAELGFGLRF